MSAANKIIKPTGTPATEVELQVAQAFVDLENNVAELKKDLRPLRISSAKEVSIMTNIYYEISGNHSNIYNDLRIIFNIRFYDWWLIHAYTHYTNQYDITT